MMISILHNLGKIESEYFCLNRNGNSHSSENFEPINLVTVPLPHDDDEIIHAFLNWMGDTFPPVIIGVDIYLFVANADEAL